MIFWGQRCKGAKPQANQVAIRWANKPSILKSSKPLRNIMREIPEELIARWSG